MSLPPSGPLRCADYEIGAEVGFGRLARVYRGQERGSGRTVAIKLFCEQPDRPGDVRAALRREAIAAARLSGLARSSRFDLVAAETAVSVEAGDKAYPALVSAFAAGEPLGPWLARAPAVGLRIGVVHALLSALQVLHGVGVAHNDLSLGNLMVGPERLAIIDFDRATVAGDPDPPVRDSGPAAFYDGGPGVACTGFAHDLRAAAILACLMLVEAHPFAADLEALLHNRFRGSNPYRGRPAFPSLRSAGHDRIAVRHWLMPALTLAPGLCVAQLLQASPFRQHRHA